MQDEELVFFNEEMIELMQLEAMKDELAALRAKQDELNITLQIDSFYFDLEARKWYSSSSLLDPSDLSAAAYAMQLLTIYSFDDVEEVWAGENTEPDHELQGKYLLYLRVKQYPGTVCWVHVSSMEKAERLIEIFT